MSTNEIKFTVLEKGSRCQIRVRDSVVIKNKKDWQTFWKQHSGSDTEPPKADFRGKMLVAIYSGEKPSGGYSVEVERIEDTGTHLVVHAKTTKYDGFVTMAFTQPFCIIQLKKVANRVVGVSGLR